MSTFLIRSATSQVSRCPVVLTVLGRPRSRSNQLFFASEASGSYINLLLKIENHVDMESRYVVKVGIK